MGCRDHHCPKHVSSEQWDENGRKQGFPPSKVKGLTYTHTWKDWLRGWVEHTTQDSSKVPVWGIPEEKDKSPGRRHSQPFVLSFSDRAFSPVGILTGGKCSLSSSSPGQLQHFSSSWNPSLPWIGCSWTTQSFPSTTFTKSSVRYEFFLRFF